MEDRIARLEEEVNKLRRLLSIRRHWWFRDWVVEQVIRQVVPNAMRSAAEQVPSPHKEALLSAAQECERKGDRESAIAARDAAAAAYKDGYEVSAAAVAAGRAAYSVDIRNRRRAC